MNCSRFKIKFAIVWLYWPWPADSIVYLVSLPIQNNSIFLTNLPMSEWAFWENFPSSFIWPKTNTGVRFLDLENEMRVWRDAMTASGLALYESSISQLLFFNFINFILCGGGTKEVKSGFIPRISAALAARDALRSN